MCCPCWSVGPCCPVVAVLLLCASADIAPARTRFTRPTPRNTPRTLLFAPIVLSATNGQTRPLRGRLRVRPVSLRNRFPTRRRLELRHDCRCAKSQAGRPAETSRPCPSPRQLRSSTRREGAHRRSSSGRRHDKNVCRRPRARRQRAYWQSATDVVPTVPPGAA
jgi:hypothetical protein